MDHSEVTAYPVTDQDRIDTDAHAEMFLTYFVELAQDDENAALAGLLRAAEFVKENFTIKPNQARPI